MTPDLISRHLDLAYPCYQHNKKLMQSFLLDWVGCLLAGLHCPEVKPLVSSLKMNERPSSQLNFALVAGFASHLLELDDSEFIGETHPGSVLFSSLLAEISEDETFKTFFTAASAGYLSLVTFGRILNPQHYESGWHATGTIGAFAATVAQGQLKGMSPKRINESLGVVSNLVSGNHMNFGSGAKFLAAGRAAENSILATRLLENGMQATGLEYTGPEGLFNYFQTKGSEAPSPELMDFSFVKAKRFPVCHCLDPIVGNIGKMAQENKISIENIQSIQVKVSDYSRKILRFDHPASIQQAKFSLPYALATALTNPELGARNFFNRYGEENLLQTKIMVVSSSDIGKMDHEIKIELSDGNQFKQFFKYDRLFGIQDRKFIAQKVESCLHPYSQSLKSLNQFISIFDNDLEALKVHEFKGLLKKTFVFPDFCRDFI